MKRFADDKLRDKIAEAMKTEVEKRNEWYGLDNWSFREVVDFVLDHLS